MNECQERYIEAIGVDIDEMDITNAKQVHDVITSSQADAVIHCAAWTTVDKAEDEIKLCRKVNKHGTKNIVDV